MFSRLFAIPNSVDTLQGARLAAVLSIGIDIIRLRRIAHRFAVSAKLNAAMAAIAAGDSRAAIRELAPLRPGTCGGAGRAARGEAAVARTGH